MKPITVTMSAFGSYADKVTLDFAKVQNGLFLITGDTGSGKTTVFDAIVYALYDRTSGGKRDGNMMRSQYAGEDTETYVEYQFSYRDDIYTILRSPEYTRPGKRRMADGSPRFVKELPKVELTMPDGTVFRGKKRETDQKITEIIGLDAEQFTQICMIAQGEFLKLLHAESRERRQIFSKIFQTKGYYKIQEELKQQATKLYIKLEDNIKDIQRETERVECDEDSEAGARWRELRTSKFPVIADITETLQAIINSGKEQEDQLRQKTDALQTRLESLMGEIKEAEAVNHIFYLYEEEYRKKEQLEEKAETFQVLKERVKVAQKAVNVQYLEKQYLEVEQSFCDIIAKRKQLEQELELSRESVGALAQQQKEKEELIKQKEPFLMKQIVSIENTMDQYEVLRKIANHCIKLEARQEEETKKLKEIELEIRALEKRQTFMANRSKELGDYPVLAERYATELEAIDTRAAELAALSAHMTELRKFSDICIELEKSAAQDTSAYWAAADIYEQKYQAFLNEQASILAKDLKEGEACPVCGSCHHPKVKELSEEAPSQEEVEAAKKNRNRAEQNREESNRKLQEAVGIFRLEEGTVKGEYQRIFSRTYPDRQQDMVEAEILKENKDIHTKRMQLQVKCEETDRAIKELQDIGKEINEVNETKDNKQKEMVWQREKLTNIQAELSGAVSEHHSRQEGLLYHTQEEASQQLLSVKKELESGEKSLADVQKRYQEEIQHLRQLEGTCVNMEQQLKELEEMQGKTQNLYKEKLAQEGFTQAEYYAIQALTSEVPDMQLQLNEYEQMVNENLTILKSLESQLAGKEKRDIKELQTDAEAIRRQLGEEKEIQMRQYGKNKKNREIKDSIKRYYEKQRTVREEYELIGNLSRTANGNMSGSVKLDFETYIQRQYFKQIIAAANRRLRLMNSEEFLLQCREVKDLKTQGQAGLDLDIYHMISDTVRDIRTLSGGESFMAALAMALGLADIVTNAAGAVHLDTMFVDEGFGSLDDNAREMAMRVLDDLAGGKRLVGIISHVNELKEQIDVKLLVEKTEKGSRAAWSFR